MRTESHQRSAQGIIPCVPLNGVWHSFATAMPQKSFRLLRQDIAVLLPLALLRERHREPGDGFSPPHFFCLRTNETGWPPKKIRQRGASKSFSFSPPTGEYPFGKTLSFYFRCRCSGADLRGLRPIALPHPQASLQSRRRSLARQTLTTTNGAAAIISGFMYPVTPRR